MKLSQMKRGYNCDTMCAAAIEKRQENLYWVNRCVDNNGRKSIRYSVGSLELQKKWDPKRGLAATEKKDGFGTDTRRRHLKLCSE